MEEDLIHYCVLPVRPVTSPSIWKGLIITLKNTILLKNNSRTNNKKKALSLICFSANSVTMIFHSFLGRQIKERTFLMMIPIRSKHNLPSQEKRAINCLKQDFNLIKCVALTSIQCWHRSGCYGVKVIWTIKQQCMMFSNELLFSFV